MANSISYASKYAPELDKMIVQVAKTGIFADNAMKAKFSGAKDVYLPELSMVGLGNYDRVNGYAKGDATLTHTKYTLSQERSRQLFIDAQDADESGVPDLAGQMVGEYTRTQVVPEIDAYAISKIFGTANTAGNVKTFAQASAVADMIAAINGCEAATGYDGGASLVAFVDPTMYAILMNSPELTRSITVNEFKQGEVNVKVRNLNGCDIIPVAANRMKSAFTFNAGSTSSAGGFAAASGAKTVNAIVLPRDSASLVKKVDKVDMYAPSDVIDRDGYVINFRLYYDLFVKNSRKGTIFAIAGE
jgi:hypothetical protein